MHWVFFTLNALNFLYSPGMLLNVMKILKWQKMSACQGQKMDAITNTWFSKRCLHVKDRKWMPLQTLGLVCRVLQYVSL